MAAVNMIYKGSYVPSISQGSKQQEGQPEQNSLKARCEVPPALLFKMLVFWDVMPCQLLNSCFALCRRYRQPTTPNFASYVLINIALYPGTTVSSIFCSVLQSYWMIPPRSIFILLKTSFHWHPSWAWKLHLKTQRLEVPRTGPGQAC
jgi:hypothetical protein